MGQKYFGTDGFRGEANVTLFAEQAYRIGRFLGWYYREGAGRRGRIVIGKDTRLSGYMLEYSVAAGIVASGADAYMLHVITTPGVSYVTRQDSFDCGIMITASHNPYYDNGIKVINSQGEKLSEDVERLMEAYIDGDVSALSISEDDLPRAQGAALGRICDYDSGRNRYMGYLISLPSNSYRGMKIGLDCANGATWHIAAAVFGALGAKCYQIGNEPSGINTKDVCGSTHIERLSRLVKEKRLDVGFAFDGDGDRCIAVDEEGRVVDGDAIIYILANRLRDRDALEAGCVAVTVMSNSGFLESLERRGIKYITTAVGDKFVYECMQNGDLSLGGEQSGHIIIRKYATTGDGILTALMLCEQMCDEEKRLSELCEGLTLYPQHLLNIRVSDKDAAASDDRVKRAIAAVNEKIGGRGRVLLRKSGTEPVLRVMVECEGDGRCLEYAEEVAEAIRTGEYFVG